jgi:hypothetical protein
MKKILEKVDLVIFVSFAASNCGTPDLVRRPANRRPSNSPRGVPAPLRLGATASPNGACSGDFRKTFPLNKMRSQHAQPRGVVCASAGGFRAGVVVFSHSGKCRRPRLEALRGTYACGNRAQILVPANDGVLRLALPGGNRITIDAKSSALYWRGTISESNYVLSARGGADPSPHESEHARLN